MPSVSIVILNYNGKHFLEQFLETVIRYSKPHEVIVADNCSSDDSVLFLKENFPNIRVIQNAENGGFAKGYNDALKQVSSDYYVLLNSDVEVIENWLEPLISSLSDPTVAGCQPKIKSYHKRTLFEHAGAAGGFLDKDFFPFCRGRFFDHVETDNGQYDTTEEVFWASGACFLIRSELYHQVGGLDEDFFAHMEEIDLCWRLKRLGYRFLAVGESEVYHVGGGTLDYLSPKKTYLNFRNSLFMITKNYDGWRTGKLCTRLILDGLAAVRFLFKGHFSHIFALLKAHVDFYKGLGKMKKKRKLFIQEHKLSPNFHGVYKKSILKKRFVENVSFFSQLDRGDFY